MSRLLVARGEKMNSKILLSFLTYLVVLPNLILSAPYSAIPDRNSRYLSGSKFFKNIDRKVGKRREKRVLEESLRGNIPEFLRNLTEIRIKEKLKMVNA